MDQSLEKKDIKSASASNECVPCALALSDRGYGNSTMGNSIKFQSPFQCSMLVIGAPEYFEMLFITITCES